MRSNPPSPSFSPIAKPVGDYDLGISAIQAPRFLNWTEEYSSSSGHSDEIFGEALSREGGGGNRSGLTNGVREALELSSECGLGAETYYASLFGRCDPQNLGRVKTSVLLSTLRDLQALVIDPEDPNRSAGSDSSCGEELQQLQQEIDPVGDDPEISLNSFTAGITTYLEKRKMCCLSPRKCSSMIEDVDGGNVQGELCSSWTRKKGRFSRGDDGRNSPNLIDLSRSQDFSLEGLAGNTSSSMLEENGEPDYRAEISDLQLRVQKLQEDNVGLKTRVSVAQDENFTLLQMQREELDKKEGELKVLQERIKRLERDVGDKNSTVNSLEDKTTVLQNRNARLENECSAYQKERKELVIEIEELKREVKKTLKILMEKDDLVHRLKTAHAVQEKQWKDKEKWLNERNEQLVNTVNQLSLDVETLELEKTDLETRVGGFLNMEGLRNGISEGGGRNRHSFHGGAIMFSGAQHSFELDISSDDIQTELDAALVNYDNFTADESESSPISKRFDVATQCDEELEVRQDLADNLFTLTLEISNLLQTYSSQLTNEATACSSTSSSPLSSSSLDGTADVDEVCVVDGKKGDSLRNGSDSKRRLKNKKSGGGGDGPEENNVELLSESNATAVVRQINEELHQFREQLKKSQELFSVLRFNSCHSISLTKSCPGLALDPANNDSNSKLNFINNTSNGSGSASKAVSCATQTDSPVIETPVLAQKLCLVSSSPSSSPPELHHHHDHDIAQHHFLSSPGDSMDNGIFDKLSDDGSVRVRDDLSMVLEVSEQENDASPGATRRTMSFEKGGMNRPKLKRMANAQEDEEGHHNNHHNSSTNHNNHQRKNSGESGRGGGATSSSGSDKNNHLLGVLDDPMMVTSDNDYVSATSSQAESVYLSLERPLKVTLGSTSGGSSLRGEGDRGSSNYRSCASSIRSGLGMGSGQGGMVSPRDCDSASLVSEGNTTFGSPLSSPSSPYWTPSQGSSSQETITPLDGERTPVNEHDRDGLMYQPMSENCSPSTPYQRFSLMSSPAQSEPSSLKRSRGMIPDNKRQDFLRMAHDPVIRNTDPDANILDNGEWRQLRQDTDLRDKETYRKTFAQEEGNEDDGAMVGVGVDGGSGSCGRSSYAFGQDEEAEQYLETIPDLAKRLFQALDVIRENKRDGNESPTQQDREDLDRKFNHMAEVFQTEHTNLEMRMCGLNKEFKESEVNLKSVAQSLKSSVSSLKEISNAISATGTIPSDSLLEVMRSLASTSEEFELYWSAMSRSARRLGMMDVQNRLHKMLDVMILYVHIIRTECDNLKSNYSRLQTDLNQARGLLKDNNITFTSSSTTGALQNNNNNDEKERLFDPEELENSQSEPYEDGESGREKILQHLLGPKKSSAGLNRSRERPLIQEKRSNGNLVVRCLSEGYEVLRRELFWPWNLEQTIKGLKQGFSLMLMILGLFVFLRGFLPSVSAIDENGCSNPSYFKNLGTYFNYCGHMSHDDAPVI